MGKLVNVKKEMFLDIAAGITPPRSQPHPAVKGVLRCICTMIRSTL